MIKPPTELVCIAQDSLYDVAPQTVDLLDIVELLLAEVQNLPGLESTVIEQVGQSLLTRARQYRLEKLPQFAAGALIFTVWLSSLTQLWQGDFSWSCVDPQCIQNNSMETRTQVG